MSAISVRGLGVSFPRVVRKHAQARLLVLEWVDRMRGQATSDVDTFWALRDVTFEIPDGTRLGIVGRNGAGKSTLCHVLCSVFRPTEGAVEVGGKVSALLSLGAGMNGELSGRENVMLYGVLMGLPERAIRAMAAEITAFAELEEFIDQPLKHYSTGMRARLAFAVAAAVSPEILLLDEVMSVGDGAFQQKCEARLGEMIRKAKAIVVVSHSMRFVQKSCDRVLWLDKGKLMLDGPCAEVVSAYQAFLAK
jgi:ABC-type polysaccharide/polyol phosphate transport system ATPase subunit